MNPLILNAMLAAERKAENEAWAAISETTPNTPGHVAAHGFWMRHRGRRELLEELVAEARAARQEVRV